MEYFKTFNKDTITISSNKKRITRNNKGSWSNSIYGIFEIDNDFNNKTVTKWLFKIHTLDDYYYNEICIGIDSSNNVNGDFTDNKNGSIGYYDNGAVFKDNKKREKYGDAFKKDDILAMIHNPNNGTLTFSIQHGSDKMKKTWYGGNSSKVAIKKGTTNTFKPIKMEDNDKKYRMCVYLQGGGTSVELLACKQQNEESKDNNTRNEEKEKELQHDKDLALAITMSLSEENKRKQKEVTERESEEWKTKEMESLKQLLNKIKQEKEEYVAANHRQRTRIIALERDIEELRNERDSTQIKNTELMEQNKTLKVKMTLL